MDFITHAAATHQWAKKSLGLRKEGRLNESRGRSKSVTRPKKSQTEVVQDKPVTTS
tara:strand:- start:336 stop:503 length:168 start_codon:yes stop_codon:yes gene_type:complete